MSHRQRLTAEKIAQRLRLIAPLIAQARTPIDPFLLETLPDADARPDLAAKPSGTELVWNSHWGGQDLHFGIQFANRQQIRFCPRESFQDGHGVWV